MTAENVMNPEILIYGANDGFVPMWKGSNNRLYFEYEDLQPIQINQSYHLELDIFVNRMIMSIDGQVQWDLYKNEHTLYRNVTCYASNTIDSIYADEIADATIRSISISANMSTDAPTAYPSMNPTADPTAENVLLRKTGPFQPSQDTIIGYIDILDEMHIEMDIVIHSFPSDWANIIHCGTGSDDYPRLPGIWIHAISATTMGFHAKFSNDDSNNYGPDTGDALVVGETYHLEMDITQGTHKVTVNGQVKADDVVSNHATYILTGITCYSSVSWYAAADVTISNLIIAGSCMFMCDTFGVIPCRVCILMHYILRGRDIVSNQISKC